MVARSGFVNRCAADGFGAQAGKELEVKVVVVGVFDGKADECLDRALMPRLGLEPRRAGSVFQ